MTATMQNQSKQPIRLNKGDFFLYKSGILATADHIVWRVNDRGEHIVTEVHHYEILTDKCIECAIIPHYWITKVIPRSFAVSLWEKEQILDENTPSPTDRDLKLKIRKWLISDQTRPNETKPDQPAIQPIFNFSTPTKRTKPKVVEDKERVSIANALITIRKDKPENLEQQAYAILYRLRIHNQTGMNGLHDAKKVADLMGLDISRNLFKKIRDEKQAKIKLRKQNRKLTLYQPNYL